MSLKISYLAIFVAVIFNQIFGFLWFTKFFGESWSLHFYGHKKGAKEGPSKEVFMRSMILFVISSLFTAYVLALGLAFFWQYRALIGVETSLFQTLEFSFLIFLGFFFPFHMGRVSWEFKSWHTVAIGAGYDLARLAVITTLFWFWR